MVNIARVLLTGIAVLVIALTNVLIVVYLERKVTGHMQWRLSMMRVGKHGVLQPIADALKLMLKEDIIPRKTDRFLFVLAPFLIFVPAYLLFTIIPISPGIFAKNLELGLFFFFAILTVMPISYILAGWSSNSKYSLIGGLRSAAQQVSYEIPLLLATIGVVMISGSLNLITIVHEQQGTILGFLPKWFIFYQPFGFILFFIGILADLNRSPFDLPEAESEIVAGPFTEYSSMKYGLFMLAEYAALFVMSSMIVIMYFGGWNGPFLPPVVWFFIKTYMVVLFGIWIKATVPRLRIDQLMNLGWKTLLPASLLNIMVTGLLILRAGPK